MPSMFSKILGNRSISNPSHKNIKRPHVRCCTYRCRRPGDGNAEVVKPQQQPELKKLVEMTLSELEVNSRHQLAGCLQGDGVNIIGVNYGSPGSCLYPRPLKILSWSKKLVRKWFNIKGKTDALQTNEVVNGAGVLDSLNKVC
ncbi:unnamed protein product [Cuscuta europaea]|uniref:Uncharacterized protein n=1 Tax=Cuscuta europaea TaxID=41803 RepID=A0A9P0YSC0_CUSEU|nr:unnamed protein product [Cuscuta europaea]